MSSRSALKPHPRSTTVALLGLTLLMLTAAGASAAERVVLAEYFTNLY
jgi:hypothetical protein